MIIANILSQNPVKVSNDFNVVKSMDECIHGLPTLVVGFDQVMKLYPDFDILDNKLDYNLYWTFKRTERRDDYQSGLSWFINHVYTRFLKEVTYVYVDPIQFTKKALIKTIKKIYSLENKISYIYKGMIYIYGEKLIFGVDLKLLKYLEYDVDKVKYKITHKSKVILDENTNTKEYTDIIVELDNQVKYIPFLHSLK